VASRLPAASVMPRPMTTRYRVEPAKVVSGRIVAVRLVDA
jgi:hypothetical protein